MARRVAPWLPPGAALDLGCGAGHNAEALRSLRADPVFEADVVPLRRRPGPAVQFDGHRLPFQDNHFAATLLAFVLQCARSPDAVLEEVSRVTAERLIILQCLADGVGGAPAVRWAERFGGHWGLSLAKRVGFLDGNPEIVRCRRYFSERGLVELAGRFGWRLAASDRGRWPLLPLRHQLLVFSRGGGAR